MSLQGLKILLVEDELLIRELFEFTLTMHQAEVRAASKVDDAIAILKEWNPDVLITDIGLPEVNGYDLIRALREMEFNPSIPVIALSGYISLNHEPVANDPLLFRISKPVDPDYLIQVILEQTRSKS
jgi:CheY-like chemotaxis protein